MKQSNRRIHRSRFRGRGVLMMIGDFKNISNLIQKYVKIILKTIKNNI
jgi:hypothetical protein